MSVKYDGCSRWSSRHRARFGEPGPLGSKTGEGVELNLTNLVAAVARSDDGMIFLETGSPSSRLCHIIEIHDDEFSKIGVAENQITDVGGVLFPRGESLGAKDQPAPCVRGYCQWTTSAHCGDDWGWWGYRWGQPSRSFKMRVLRLSPEYQCHPLWEEQDSGLKNLDAEILPISDDLVQELKNWSALFESTYKGDEPALSGFKDFLSERRFVVAGLNLACRLMNELGDQYLIRVRL
jgi:hypothetical protein